MPVFEFMYVESHSIIVLLLFPSIQLIFARFSCVVVCGCNLFIFIALWSFTVLIFYHLFIHFAIDGYFQFGAFMNKAAQVLSFLSLDTNQRILWLRHRTSICSKDASISKQHACYCQPMNLSVLEGVSWCSIVVWKYIFL